MSFFVLSLQNLMEQLPCWSVVFGKAETMLPGHNDGSHLVPLFRGENSFFCWQYTKQRLLSMWNGSALSNAFVSPHFLKLVLLCSPNWTWTHNPASASWVLGWTSHTLHTVPLPFHPLLSFLFQPFRVGPLDGFCFAISQSFCLVPYYWLH